MPKNWIPRRFGEHKAHKHMRRLGHDDLLKGDILIAKEWENTDMDVRIIRTSQAVFSHARGGSSQSEHVLLNCADGRVYVIESLGDGLNIGNSVRPRDHVVYSCMDETLRQEVCKVAEALAGVADITPLHEDQGDTDELTTAKTFAAYAAHKATVKYRSYPGLAQSVFRRKSQGRFANARLKKLYDVVYQGKSAAGIRMICSEFAASCYEVAALKIERVTGKNPLPFGVGVDPRAMTAKALEAVLQRSNTCFLMAGSYVGAAPPDPSEQAFIQKLAALYVNISREYGGGQRMTVDEAYDVIVKDSEVWALHQHDVKSRDAWRKNIARAYDLRMLR